MLAKLLLQRCIALRPVSNVSSSLGLEHDFIQSSTPIQEHCQSTRACTASSYAVTLVGLQAALHAPQGHLMCIPVLKASGAALPVL